MRTLVEQLRDDCRNGVVALRMIRALVRLGWTVDRVAGSHHVLVRPGHRPITVPVHRGRALKEPIARAILKQAGVSEDEFFDVYSLPAIERASSPWTIRGWPMGGDGSGADSRPSCLATRETP